MKRWIYVRAEAPYADLTMVSFAHAFVRADSERQAYEKGQSRFRFRPTKETQSGKYRFMNDYVVAR